MGWFTFFTILIVINTIQAEDDQYRLPPNYIVNHYDIQLTIPEEAFTAESNDYSGSVQIEFQVSIDTSEVKLHSKSSNINIKSIILSNYEGKLEWNVHNMTDVLSIQLETVLVKNVNYTLKIQFAAKLLSSDGLYKVSYKDESNSIQYVAATQFEPTSARKAFPCFDEPKYKATFTYTLTYPSDMTALTNTAEINSTYLKDNQLKTTTYEQTPRMSVYLVAFTISKYTCDQGILEENSNVKYQICSRQDKQSARNWAMTVTPKVIDYLNSYTGIKYTYSSLLKLDQVAVAGRSGAMENWGLVLYSESALLFDETLQTNANKQSIAAVISHELAHQWFGNLVTCKWWSELLLNEGFATMFEFYTTAAAVPDFEMEEQYVIKIVQPMMADDGLLGVPALRSNATTQNEISSKFGRYSYYKGGSVLRMIEHIVGRENFKLGIRKYLKDNEFQPVEPEDLWNALESIIENKAGLLPISSKLSTVVENWVNKSGYPVLAVTLENSTIKIAQKRFLLSGSESEGTKWYVPVSYTTSENNDKNKDTSPRGWVTPTDDLVIESFPNKSSSWILVNNQHTGYYRVNYDQTLWNRLANALKQTNFSGIHILNRAQIVEDSFNLAKAGLLSFHQVLKNVEFLANDDSYYSWYPAVNIFTYLSGKTSNTTKLGVAISNHFLELSEKVSSSLPLSNLKPSNHINTLKQILIHRYSCKYGYENCIVDAKALFNAYKMYNTKPNINIRSIVYCNALRYSENPNEDWDFLWRQYENDLESNDRTLIWAALGCATNTEVLKAFLSKILSETEEINTNLYTSIFSSIYNSNEVGVDAALDYLTENFDAIYQKYNSKKLSVSGIFTGLGSVLNKKSQLEKFEKFIATIKNETVLIFANGALSTAKANQEIIEKHKTDLYEYYKVSEEDENDDESNNDGDDKPGTGGAAFGNTSSVVLLLVTALNIIHFI